MQRFSLTLANCGKMSRLVTATVSAMMAATVGISNVAQAEDDFYRQGCYLGLAGTYAIPIEKDDLEKQAEKNDSIDDADVGDSFGLHARAGCRSEFFAGELHYEGLPDLDLEINGADVDLDGWALTLDGKLYPLSLLKDHLPPLAQRFQPFATVGFGYLEVNGRGGSDAWDFAARLGGGLDIFVTRSIAINVDTTVVLPTTDSLEHFDYVSIGWGLVYLF
jgi:opacity protein-like surface antigen